MAKLSPVNVETHNTKTSLCQPSGVSDAFRAFVSTMPEAGFSGLNTMQLHQPFIITARLLPGLKVCDRSFISMEIISQTTEKLVMHTISGRVTYRYYIDTGV